MAADDSGLVILASGAELPEGRSCMRWGDPGLPQFFLVQSIFCEIPPDTTPFASQFEELVIAARTGTRVLWIATENSDKRFLVDKLALNLIEIRQEIPASEIHAESQDLLALFAGLRRHHHTARGIGWTSLVSIRARAYSLSLVSQIEHGKTSAVAFVSEAEIGDFISRCTGIDVFFQLHRNRRETLTALARGAAFSLLTALVLHSLLRMQRNEYARNTASAAQSVDLLDEYVQYSEYSDYNTVEFEYQETSSEAKILKIALADPANEAKLFRPKLVPLFKDLSCQAAEQEAWYLFERAREHIRMGTLEQARLLTLAVRQLYLSKPCAVTNFIARKVARLDELLEDRTLLSVPALAILLARANAEVDERQLDDNYLDRSQTVTLEPSLQANLDYLFTALRPAPTAAERKKTWMRLLERYPKSPKSDEIEFNILRARLTESSELDDETRLHTEQLALARDAIEFQSRYAASYLADDAAFLAMRLFSANGSLEESVEVATSLLRVEDSADFGFRLTRGVQEYLSTRLQTRDDEAITADLMALLRACDFGIRSGTDSPMWETGGAPRADLSDWLALSLSVPVDEFKPLSCAKVVNATLQAYLKAT